MADLLELAGRCEAATGPDRELDALIAATARICGKGWKWADSYPHWEGRPGGRVYLEKGGPNFAAPAYTASLDAAMTLVPEGIELAIYVPWVLTDGFPKNPDGSITLTDDMPRGCWVRSFNGYDPFKNVQATARTPALALTAAALRARSQAAVGHPAASDPRPANQAHQVGTDDRAENNHAG